MKKYKIRFNTSFGGSLEVTVKAESDISARKIVIEKFAALCKDILYSLELPLNAGEEEQNDFPTDNLTIQL